MRFLVIPLLLISSVAFGAVTIDTADPLPQTEVGEAYSVTFSASGGTAPYTWSFTTPANIIPYVNFPVDLTLSSSGVLSGTITYLSLNPGGVGTSYGWSIQVEDSLGATAIKTFHLQIQLKLGVVTNHLFGGMVGVALNTGQTLTAAGGITPYTWAVTGGALPTGVSLNTSTGALTGTPTTTNGADVTFTVTDSHGFTASGTYPFRVTASGDGDVEVLMVPPSPVYIDQNGNGIGRAIMSTTVAWAGKAGNLYFKSSATTGLPTGVTMTWVCSTGGTGIADRACFGPDGTGRFYQFNSSNAYFATTPIFVFQATGAVAPGTYPMTVEYDAAVGTGGAEKAKTISFNLVVTQISATPTNQRQFPGVMAPYLPISGLSTFISDMTRLGNLWDSIPGGGFCFSPSTENNTCATFYYDGCWNYLRFHDYTNEVPGGPFITFATEAGGLCDAYASQVNSGLVTQGWHVFPHGMEKAYQVTGQAEYLNAMNWLANSGTWADQGGAPSSFANLQTTAVIDPYIRETSYQLMAYVVAERNGLTIHAPPSTSLPSNYTLDQRAADYIVGYFYNMFGPAEAQSHCCVEQLFYDGIAARALMDWYQTSSDARVPVVLKLFLDKLNTNAYINHGDPSDLRPVGWTPYIPGDVNQGFLAGTNPCAEGCNHYLAELNLLVDSVSGWYYWLTGDENYRGTAILLLNHYDDVDSSIIFSPKAMNQQYFFGLDTWQYMITANGNTYGCRMCGHAVSSKGVVWKK